MPKIDISMEQANALRDLLTHVQGTREYRPCLRDLDHRLGVLLGCDPYVLYQDLLMPHVGLLIMGDGSIDLNYAEQVLGPYGPPDLNLAERVIADWRDRGIR